METTILRSHQVEIKRKSINSAYYKKNVESIDEGTWKIGASIRNNTVNRGLSLDEEEKYLPQIIGIKPSSEHWEKATRDYWNNISVKVPEAGLKLEIGFKYKSKEDADRNQNGTPININDYVLYKYCLEYAHVANHIDLIGASPKIRFYIFDQEEEKKAKTSQFKVRSEAMKLYLETLADRSLVDDILNIYKFDTTKMDEDEKSMILETKVKDTPESFLLILKDDMLKYKSFVNKCLHSGKLTQVPNTETIVFGSDVIGNTIAEAAIYLKSKSATNLKVYETLMAQMNLLTPKEVKVVEPKKEEVKPK